MLTSTFTTFDRAAMPSNLITVADWRRLGRASFRGMGWLTLARKYAKDYGGALVWRADDSLIVFTKLEDGRVRRSTHKPGTWRWAS